MRTIQELKRIGIKTPEGVRYHVLDDDELRHLLAIAEAAQECQLIYDVDARRALWKVLDAAGSDGLFGEVTP